MDIHVRRIVPQTLSKGRHHCLKTPVSVERTSQPPMVESTAETTPCHSSRNLLVLVLSETVLVLEGAV